MQYRDFSSATGRYIQFNFCVVIVQRKTMFFLRKTIFVIVIFDLRGYIIIRISKFLKKVVSGGRMSLTTDITFLKKIIDGDEISWDNFHRIYSPLIRSCGSHWGLNELECDELVQEVMICFFNNSHAFIYDRTKGSFRSYLRTVARNSVFSILKKRSDWDEERDSQEKFLDYAFDEKWDSEWHNYLFTESLKILKDEMEDISYRSFCMYVLEEKSPAQVASALGISVNAVYVNKCRALEHLRRSVRMLEKL